MTAIALSPRASYDTSTAHFAGQISGLKAEVDVNAGQALMISANGGYRLYDGTRPFVGIAPESVKAGEPLTVYGLNQRFKLSEGLLTTGTSIFLTATGGYDTAATAADAQGALIAVTKYDAVIVRVGKLA